MHCLNCIRCMQNSTFETGLIYVIGYCNMYVISMYPGLFILVVETFKLLNTKITF